MHVHIAKSYQINLYYTCPGRISISCVNDTNENVIDYVLEADILH